MRTIIQRRSIRVASDLVPATIVAVAALASVVVHAQDPWGEIVAEHGRYSKTYQSPWSTLKTGKEIADKDPASYAWQTSLKDQQNRWSGGAECRLQDKAFKLNSAGTLFQFKNCKRVVIENVAIWITAKCTVTYTFSLIGNDEVYINNVFIRGSARSNHISIKGTKVVLVQNVEIEGLDYDGDGTKYAGRGIALWGGGSVANDLPSPVFEFVVIQNNYVHDFTANRCKGNFPEGIMCTSCGDGIVFNNTIENWRKPGAENPLQVGHRRYDAAYGNNRRMRVERNVSLGNAYVKQGADGNREPKPNHHVIFANNVWDNLFAQDNGQDQIWHINDTFIFRDSPIAVKFWRSTQDTHYYNNLYFFDYRPRNIFYVPSCRIENTLESVKSDHNFYFAAGGLKGRFWQGACGENASSFADWQKLGKDKNGGWATDGSVFAAFDRQGPNVRLAEDSLARGYGTDRFAKHSDPAFRVAQDFFGNPIRSGSVDPGAVQYNSLEVTDDTNGRDAGPTARDAGKRFPDAGPDSRPSVARDASSDGGDSSPPPGCSVAHTRSDSNHGVPLLMLLSFVIAARRRHLRALFRRDLAHAAEAPTKTL